MMLMKRCVTLVISGSLAMSFAMPASARDQEKAKQHPWYFENNYVCTYSAYDPNATSWHATLCVQDAASGNFYSKDTPLLVEPADNCMKYQDQFPVVTDKNAIPVSNSVATTPLGIDIPVGKSHFARCYLTDENMVVSTSSGVIKPGKSIMPDGSTLYHWPVFAVHFKR